MLHIACSVGDEAAVKYLHSVKANPNVYDKVGLLHLVKTTESSSLVSQVPKAPEVYFFTIYVA